MLTQQNIFLEAILRFPKSSGYRYTPLLNKIVFLRENKDEAEINVLKKEIESVEEVASKKWLLEKLDELAGTAK